MQHDRVGFWKQILVRTIGPPGKNEANGRRLPEGLDRRGVDKSSRSLLSRKDADSQQGGNGMKTWRRHAVSDPARKDSLFFDGRRLFIVMAARPVTPVSPELTSLKPLQSTLLRPEQRPSTSTYWSLVQHAKEHSNAATRMPGLESVLYFAVGICDQQKESQSCYRRNDAP